MQLTPRSQFVERIVTSPEGIPFKVLFLVYEENGQVKGKIISATAIKQAPLVGQNKIISLPIQTAPKAVYEVVSQIWDEIIPSPFSTLLYVNCTIPRGPNL